MAPEDLSVLVSFFKALSNESRLRIVSALAEREATVSELAALVGLKDPTVSHHLALLRELGLVSARVEGTSHVYRLEPSALEGMARRVLAPLPVQVDRAGFREKVLAAFVEGERLRSIPASRRKREVILDWLAERLPTEELGEREISDLLARHHEDVATLRRELVGAGLVSREKGRYRRV